MVRHLTIMVDGYDYIKEILNKYVDLATFEGVEFIRAVPWPSLKGRSSFELTVLDRYSVNGKAIRGIDVLWANLYLEVAAFAEEHPEYEVRWSDSCHREIGNWFACTTDSILYNVVRSGNYHLREVYEAQGVRAHTGHEANVVIKGIRTFGEANQARPVWKAILRECAKSDPFLDLRSGQEIMNLCGSDVIILLESNKGQFQLVNDTIYSTDEQLLLASNSPWKGANYSFLYDHPAFQ